MFLVHAISQYYNRKKCPRFGGFSSHNKTNSRKGMNSVKNTKWRDCQIFVLKDIGSKTNAILMMHEMGNAALPTSKQSQKIQFAV